MNKSGKIILIVTVVVGFLLLIYYFGFAKKEEVFVTDDWSENYKPESKSPFGTYMLKELLDTVGMFGNFLEIEKKLKDQLEDNDTVNDIYFFVGKQNFMDEDDADFLYDFIGNGNTAIMICDYFPVEFLEVITFDGSMTMIEPAKFDSLETFRFNHTSLKNSRLNSLAIYNNETTERYWAYFDITKFDMYDEDSLSVLGTNDEGLPNFIKITYGDGLIYLHSTPYLFTNLSLMKKQGFEYAERIFKHVPPGRMQWDKYNLQFHYDNNSSDEDGDGGVEERKSILQFIMDNPPLIWATLILLIGALLYAIYKGKRLQKVIPANELKENTSLGYITTLSSLYLQENKHQKLVRLKEKTFLNFIADHYYIITKEPDKKFFEKVAMKSQIEIAKIEEIFTLFRKLEMHQTVEDEELILLHQKIEYFYKKCR